MRNRAAVVRGGILATLACIAFSTELFPQAKTLSRVYDPVLAAAGNLAPLVNVPISSLFAYRYDATLGEFSAIPFQIDEVDTSGKFLRETDGLADANDEIVFMPGDAGDRAPTDKWVTGSQQNTRIELEVSDPLAPGGKGWVYLFRDVVTQPPVVIEQYVRYHRGPSTTVGTDTVFGKSYVEAHDATGWFTYTAIPVAAGGDGQDILDRQKVRAEGVYLFLFPKINEEANFPYNDVRYGGGPVRGLRELSLVFTFFGAALDTFSFVTQHFPYSVLFSAKEAKIPVIEGLRVNLIRQSMDLNEHASGMKFFNVFNQNGITVDGVSDSQVTDTIIDTPTDSLNWWMVTGNPGSVVVLMKVPRIGTSRKLYYKDNATMETNDTGDKKSYGDSGVLITSTGSITGSFSFDFTNYYLGKIESHQAVDTGDQFKQCALNPMQVTALEQSLTTTAVTDNRGQPLNFVLDDAQPNPFWPLRGIVRLSFKIAQNTTSPILRIFNLLGQEVARFDFNNSQVANNSSAHQILWDGRGANGQLLTAGVYFYQLQAGAQIATKKLIIIR